MRVSARDGVELGVDQLRAHGDQEAELEPLNPGKKEIVNEVRSGEKWPRSRERSSQSKMLSSRPSRVRDSTLVREKSFSERVHRPRAVISRWRG